MSQPQQRHPRLRGMETLARFMDSQFRIPGTGIRFGFDSIIGLVPGVGDFSTFAVSGYIVLIMAQNGASGNLVSRMVFNILLDSIIGSIPLIGDLFDVAFKANNRNMRLMQRHYVEGRYNGGAWKVVVPVLLAVLAIIFAIIWGMYKLLTAIF